MPWWWWAVAIVIMGASVEAIFVAGPHFSERGGWPAVIGAFATSTAVVSALLAWLGSASVRVHDGAFVAGRRTLPAHLIRAAYPLDAEQTRALLGPRARHDAVMYIRGWVSTAVRIDITGSPTGTPYWVVSTRRPRALAAAVTAAASMERRDGVDS